MSNTEKTFDRYTVSNVNDLIMALRNLNLTRLETDDIDCFLTEFDQQHRTTQQAIYRLFVALTEHLAAKGSGESDARNAASVVLAKLIVKTTAEWEQAKHLPYI